MMYAKAQDGTRALATPRQVATCPTCDGPVQAKCGAMVAWHWAHHARDCDPWAERDTEWHWGWQQAAPDPRREVVMGNHRADIVAPDGTVVEVQHSSLGAIDIRLRERHYGRMVWIFDARKPYAEDRLNIRTKAGQEYVTFRWKHPRKSIAVCRALVLLDLDGATLLRLGRIHAEAPCGGWGRLVPADQVRTWIGAAA